MPYLAPISVCLLLLLGLGLLERFLRDRAWRAVPIRIHVNGTRGKSSVTRMIWAALRAAGIPALAKTTGAAPCLLLPDGSEQLLRRRGKPNIREQLRTLRLAKRTGARAVVLECMAIAPDLQWVAEQEMVRATIGVITNVRTDHTEAMGRTRDEIAASLANTIPRRSVLVVGEQPLADAYQRCAAARGTRTVVATREATFAEPVNQQEAVKAPAPAEEPWEMDNQATALAVTRELGIEDKIALAAMRNREAGRARSPSGPGALLPATRPARRAGPTCTLAVLDARKANDPESFLQVWNGFMASSRSTENNAQRHLLIYNHRSDRPHRLLHFAEQVFAQSGVSEVLVTGERPAWTLWRALRRRPGLPPLRFASACQLPALLSERAGHCHAAVFCGNIHGLDLAEALPPLEAHT